MMNSERKIVFVLNTIGAGGIARVVTTFANQIAALGKYEVFLVVMHKKQSLYELHPSIQVIQNQAQRKPGGKLGYILNAAIFIRKTIIPFRAKNSASDNWFVYQFITKNFWCKSARYPEQTIYDLY